MGGRKKPPPVTYKTTVPEMLGLPGVAVVKEPEEKVSDAYLRYAAGIYYSTDLNACTVDEMAKHPVYGTVPLYRLKRWSWEDEWLKMREANKEKWRQRIEAAIGNKLAQARVRQLEGLERIYNKALEKLEHDLVKANTWEGVAGILVRLAEVMDESRSKMAAEVWPSMVTHAGDNGNMQSMVRPKLSREEARAAAMLIIEKRRAQQKQNENSQKVQDGAEMD